MNRRLRILATFVVVVPIGVWITSYLVWAILRWVNPSEDLGSAQVAWWSVVLYVIVFLIQLPTLLRKLGN